MKIRDPFGQTWRIRRRWLPWWRRIRSKGVFELANLAGLGGDTIIAVIILVAITIPLFVLMVLLTVEVVLLLLLPAVAVLRMVITRRWPLVVRRGKELAWDESVRGWSASRDRIQLIGAAISAGRVLEVHPPPR